MPLQTSIYKLTFRYVFFKNIIVCIVGTEVETAAWEVQLKPLNTLFNRELIHLRVLYKTTIIKGLLIFFLSFVSFLFTVL